MSRDSEQGSVDGGSRGLLSRLFLPVLRARFPDRGLLEAEPPDPCAVFPGVHPGIRCFAIDDDELTLRIEELTHVHFAEHAHGLTDAERGARVMESVVEFLGAPFADQVVV